MWIHSISLLYLFVSSLDATPTTSHVLHEKRDSNSIWKRKDRLHEHTIIPLRISLSQNNMHRIEEFLADVSHPGSSNYGKHWSPEQVAKTFASSDDTITSVKTWLADMAIDESRMTHSHNNWIEVSVTASEAEKLLQTQYFVHENEEGHQTIGCDEYWLPRNLQGHIDYILPTIQMDATLSRRSSPSMVRPSAPTGIIQPLDVALIPENPKTSTQSCGIALTPACVRALYDIPDPSTTKPFTKGRVPMGVIEFSPWSYSQEDLNLFFDTYTDIPTGTKPHLVSINNGSAPTQGLTDPILLDEPDGDFEIAMSIVYPNNISLYQINAGSTYNNFMEALDSTYCGGNDPSYDAPSSKGVCGSISRAQVPDVISISWGYAEKTHAASYLTRQCNEFGKLGLMGITVVVSSGDVGVQGPGDYKCISLEDGQIKNSTVGRFVPSYPASCPFVTTVGATQLVSPNSSPEDGEIAVKPYASGGGFSDIFPIPSWQQDTIHKYYQSNAPPYSGQLYNNSQKARGYPDVSANGLSYAMYLVGQAKTFSGTSAAAPTFASIISLINGQRLAANKGTVGFINPLLYSNPGVLNDIVTGRNPGCSTQGFSCVQGWDPVTGLGTPNYTRMSTLFMDQL